MELPGEGVSHIRKDALAILQSLDWIELCKEFDV